MKAQSECFRRKNSKQGLALSTSMAICIVLAILVSVLVSMAALNITTTQTTVYQRDAYITAKSALAFVESYYDQHDIPGKEDTEGTSLVVFNDTVVAKGAKIYLIKDPSVSATAYTDDKINALKADCVKVYVDVTKTGELLDMTAHCKYGDGNFYELSREFNLGGDSEVKPNSFTGNVSYEAKSDTRFLRIHVRTNPAFEGAPSLWTWYNLYNANENDKVFGKSSLVNKLSYDVLYPSDHSGGYWDDEKGIGGNCAMQYEGNGWYLTTIQFGTDQDVNFVNAIVAKDKAKRKDNNHSQSWELFGLPVPPKTQTGEANGVDVYITLNRKKLLDARNEDGHGNDTDDLNASGDMFTYYFKNGSYGNKNVNEFAKFCGSWYTVYTKNNTSTMHYRVQGKYKETDYSDSEKPSGFTYEGYGWYRKTVTNYTAADIIEGYSFESAALVSQNEYGQEQVREGFICKLSNGNTELYDSEAAANEAFAVAGEIKAGDYVTVNVKAARQPVDKEVKTTIKFESKWDKSDGTTPTTPATTEPENPQNPENPENPEGSGVSYSPSKEKLVYQKLYSMLGYAVIGTFNNWGCAQGSNDNRYENILDQRMEFVDGKFQLKVEHCDEGEYQFKVIELLEESGSISKEGWEHAFGSGDYLKDNTVYNLAMNNRTLVITFDPESHSTTVGVEVGDIDTNQTYAVIGDMNDWGGGWNFEQTTPMNYNFNTGTYVCDLGKSFVVQSTKQYNFKVIKTTGLSGPILEEHKKELYGADGKKGTSADNYVYTPPLVNGNSATFTIQIHFNPADYSISVIETPTGIDGIDFYLIGNYNNWAGGHIFNRATSDIYKFTPAGTVDVAGRYVYTYTTPTVLDPGDYEFKVISNESLANGADPNAEQSIDYGKSWGEPDNDEEKRTYGINKSDGSLRSGIKFTLEKASKVEITFYYDQDSTKSSITYTTVNTVDVKSIYLKFYNAKGKDENGEDTEFAPWDQLWVTYKKENSVPVCKQVEFDPNGGNSISVAVPEDADTFYFSNRNSTSDRGADYQCTQEIKFKKGYAGRTFRPTHYVDDPNSNSADHKSWKVTTESSVSLGSESGTYRMAYSGGLGHCNLYDAPLVTVLKMIASNGTMDGNYAFSAYPYDKYRVKDNNNKELCVLYFKTNQKITYQGDTFYYIKETSDEKASYPDPNDDNKNKSFLIVQDTAASHTGYLLEDQMALMYTGVNGGGFESGTLKMQNRAGASFPSSKKYYNGDDADYNFDNYTPSWYTFKVPVSTELKISEINGVVSDDEVIFSGEDFFVPANATENYKQPIYIFQDYANENDDAQKEKFYTYDTNIGTVDTTTDDKVSVYFANSGSSDETFEKVGCYAYNPVGKHWDEPNVKRDYTDSDNRYYKLTFNTGEYCYFIFYDSKDGGFDTATKKTDILYLTGYEDPDTRAYDILAYNMNSSYFTSYIHPRTQALFAAISIDSASRAARIPSGYTYDFDKKTYNQKDSFSMDELDKEATKAWNYYNSGNNGTWTASNPKKYMDLALAVQEFTSTITKSRIYIAQNPEDYPDTSRVFKECSYRSSTFDYQERWVNLLLAEYDKAIRVYDSGNSQQTDAAYLRQCSANMNALIASPLLEWNTHTVQIIVNDQKKKVKDETTGKTVQKGGWGPGNIHLYNKTESEWVDAKYDLYKTTQSDQGFYAYVFKITSASNKFMIAQSTPPADKDGYSVEDGHRYVFVTADETFENDGSTMVYKVTDDEVIEGNTSGAYSWFDLRPGDKSFTLQFLYDTTIKGKSKKQHPEDPEPVEQEYKVYAGCYTINASYAGFAKDLSGEGKKGIDLFSENAKKFFENPASYGMSSSASYSTWSSDISGRANIDIMCDRINKNSQISASTTKARKVSFRYKSEKTDHTLKLMQNVNLTGGSVSIAVNEIDLGSYDMFIEAKTVTFLNDTVVKTTAHGSLVIPHGTYSFNSTNSATTYKISLQSTGGDPDWRDHYTLISNSSSKLKGGYYITHG